MKYLFLLSLIVSCAQNSRKYAEIDEPEKSVNVEELDNSFKQRPVENKYISDLDFILSSENPLARESIISSTRPEGDINEIVFLCKTDDIEKGLQKADAQYYKYKNHPDYWNAIGLCFFEQKQFRKALLYFQKTIDIDSNYAPAINNFGIVYLAQNKINKAYEAFMAASKKMPAAVTPRLNLAQLLMTYGLYNKADIQLANLPELLQVKILRLFINYYTKDKNESLKAIQVLWDTNFNDSLLGLNYSIILAKAGKKSEANKVLKSIDAKNISKTQYQQVARIIEGSL
jgi:tetratricopeptide (TPR) repeat protein